MEFKINLLRPARAPRFVARARVLRAGRTLTVCTAEVFGIGPGGEELVATMLSTVIARPAVPSPSGGAVAPQGKGPASRVGS